MFKSQAISVIFSLIFTISGSNGVINNIQPMVEYYSFDDTQYVFFSQRVTWDEANMLCITFDAKLAILNTKSKATNVAQSMAESDIAMEDVWLGARRFQSTWYWNDGINSSSFNYVIPIEPDIDDFPPWSRTPSRATKECLAIDRKSHSLPNFVDLDCRLLRPFVCEKKSGHLMKNPVPSKWVKMKKNIYTLYHGRVTWTEAVTYCRSQGMRLAVVNNQNIVNVLSYSMTKSRPDFENVWIGARYSYGQWTWLSTGSVLDSKTDDTGYPPWRFGRPEKNSGCLLLDRHLENQPSFIEMSCDAKRDFVCEKYSEGELEDWMNKPIKLDHDDISIIIHPTEKTWDESKLYCQERGSVLTYVDNLPLANVIVTTMGDHPREITHLWLGGLYNLNTSEWRWIYNNKVIPLRKNKFGFPPWANSVIDTDARPDESACLNLDRIDHTQPHFYGLNCESKQAFACTTNCESPPPVANGNWNCVDHNSTSKICSLKCDNGFFTMGIKTLRCSSRVGWFTIPGLAEFPICLDPKNYLNRFTRSLSQDLLKSSGYYILLSHANEKFNEIALLLSQKLLTLFPLNAHRIMGMSHYFKNSRKNIPFSQSDTCAALELLLAKDQLKTEEQRNGLNELNYTEWSLDLKTNGRKVLIIAIVDSSTAKRNQEVFDKLRAFGHYVVTIGLNNDWEDLMPLATISRDQHSSIYLFNEVEFETAVKDLSRMKNRYSKCQEQTANTKSQTEVKKPNGSTGEKLKVLTSKSTTTSTPPPTQSVRIIQKEPTTINSKVSQVAANVKTNESEKNPIKSNGKASITKDVLENIDAAGKQNENISNEKASITKEDVPENIDAAGKQNENISNEKAPVIKEDVPENNDEADKPDKNELNEKASISSNTKEDVPENIDAAEKSDKNKSNEKASVSFITKEDVPENIDAGDKQIEKDSKETKELSMNVEKFAPSDNIETVIQDKSNQ